MTQKNNAARVAVEAKPCPKHSDAIPMPSWQQVMLAALAFAQDSLEKLESASSIDKDLGDADVDVDVSFAMDLVLERIKRMRANLPTDRATFEVEWYAAGSVVNLSVRSFSRPASYYFRCLQSVQRLFEVFAPAVEFIERGERHGK